MPTKPNRAGQQQNYVPQGNGDASGEYADEATGSNIHFTNFKKPDEDSPLNTKKSHFTDVKESVEYISSYIENYETYREQNKSTMGFYSKHDLQKIANLHNSDAVKDKSSLVKMANAYKAAADKGKPYWIVNDAMYSGRCCYFKQIKGDPDQKGILIQPNVFEEGSTVYGSTWFHENGHLLDNTFNDGQGNYSVEYVSKKYNDTLEHVLDDEFKTYFTKARKQEIIDKIEALRDEVYAYYGYDYKAMEQQRKELNAAILPYKQELKEKYAELENKLNSGEIDYWAYLRLRSSYKARYQNQTNYITYKISRLISKDRKADIESEVARRVYQKYSTITDMYSSLGKGRLHPEYGGYHDKKYWQTEKSKRVKEFFAEAFSGKTLDDTHLAQLKEAFPKSVEIFEEIYNELK